MTTQIKINLGKNPVEKQDTCCHIWRIEAPDGPTSLGRCKRCGMIKEFSNTPVELTTERERVNDVVASEDLPTLIPVPQV